jgi:hypothetical protein
VSEAIEQRSSEDMSKIPSKKVTIDVPEPEYEVLKQIAEEQESSIRGLVRRGVDLVILDNKPLLDEMAEKATKAARDKSENISNVLTKLEK